MTNLVCQYDGLLADLDGVIYAGNQAIPHAIFAINQLKIPVAYVTNNAARSPQQIAKHLTDLGIVNSLNVLTSVQAAIKLLQKHVQIGSKVLVVGSEYLRQQVASANFVPIEQFHEKPQAIIQGFAPQVGWKNLAQIAYAKKTGILWIATNTDLTIPQAEGLAPGNGALIGTVTHVTGETPLVAGKPQATLFCLAKEQLKIVNPLVVGDRLDTDIFGGNNAKMGTALVLTGVNTVWDALIASPPQRPTYIIDNLQQLNQPYPKILQQNNKYYCENSWAEIKNNQILTNFSAQPPTVFATRLQLARAVCAAWWANQKLATQTIPNCAPELRTYLQTNLSPK